MLFTMLFTGLYNSVFNQTNMSKTGDVFKYLRNIEHKTGMAVETIRATPVADLRTHFESQQKIKTPSLFPLIGRGNITRCTMSHDDVESMLDEVLA